MTDSSLPVPEGYSLVRVIGRGASSVVWEARRLATGAPVAVKILDADVSDPAALRRFERETAAMRSVHHSSVLPVLDAGVRAGRPWLVTELCRRGSLATRIADGGPLDVPTAVRVLHRLAAALATAHAARVVHCAVTPATVLLTDSGEPALGDFGIARLAQGQTLSPDHVAPELFDGGPGSPSSDVYSLGSTVWELLVGHPPVPHRPLPAAEAVPDDVLALLRAMTARDPQRRPASMAQVGAAVTALARDRGIDLDAPVLPPPTAVRTRLIGADGWSDPLPAEQVLTSLPPRAADAKAPYGTDPDGAPLYTTPAPFRPRADDEEPVRRRRVPLIAASVLAVLIALGVVFGIREGRSEAPVVITPAAAVPSTAPPTPEATSTTGTTSATPAPTRRTRATTTTRPATPTPKPTPTTRVTPQPVVDPPTTDEPAPTRTTTRTTTEQSDPATNDDPAPGDGGSGGGSDTGSDTGSDAGNATPSG